MINIPYEDIVEKILESGKISKEEFDLKFKQKMEQLNGLISKSGAAHIIANELGIKIFDSSNKQSKISKLLPMMKNVEVVGRVVSVFEVREFATEKSSGKVGSFILGDETGTVRITCWHDATDHMKDLEKGTIIKLTNGFVKENQGKAEIHLNDSSVIEKNPEGVVIPEVKPEVVDRKQIADLSESDFNVEILGTVVQSYSPNFFEVCPECGKRARANDEGNVCPTHGVINPDFSYVMNAMIDDGTNNVRVSLFREQVQKFLDKSAEDILSLRENPEAFEEIKYSLLGSIAKIRGKVNRNEMFDRLELVARDVDMNPDAKEELDRLSKK